MKTYTLLAMASGATATFMGANPFQCPSNTDNTCTPKQSGGFNWGDLNLGNFQSYDGFTFKGWQCVNDKSFTRRGHFDRRTSGKVIDGRASSNKANCPSLASKDKFSLDQFHLSTEFDCDLEFHYGMPDGSTCRQRSACKAGGSTIKNSQCGGAQDVTIVYPSQTNKPKPDCAVTVTSIDFDCSSRPATTSIKTTSVPPKVTTTSVPPKATSTSVPPKATTTSTPPKETTTTTPPKETTTVTPPKDTTTVTPPKDTTTVTPPKDTTIVSSVVSSTSVTSTMTTVVPCTTTIFTTSVSTVTKCSGDVKECPGSSTTAIVTVSVPLSTTVTQVTSTLTTVLPPVATATASDSKSTTVVPGTTTVVPETTTVVPETTTVISGTTVIVPGTTTVVPGTTVIVPGTTTTATIPAGPAVTLPCPDVVPQCLNTWIFSLGCKDNTDTSCYCPDAAFVKNVFQCFYAHGSSDAVISEAVVYFQGICAPHIPQNPAIVTGPTVTSYITVTAPPTPIATNPAAITTIFVNQTTVVPCTDDSGNTIPNSSTTQYINTSIVVPKLGFTTAPPAADATGTASTGEIIGLVPITTPVALITGPAPTRTPVGGVPAASGVPAGTGVSALPSSTTTIPVKAAGERMYASLALAAMAVVAAL